MKNPSIRPIGRSEHRLPTGTVTFLFTDIEGSTRLWQEQPEAMENAHARHDEILRQAIELNHGYIFQVVGDSFSAAFHNAIDGLRAVLSAQRGLQVEPWSETAIIKVRMGLHTGAAKLLQDRSGKYEGYVTLASTQRVMSAAHGGQILLSQTTHDLSQNDLPEGISLRDVGEHSLKGLPAPLRLYQLIAPDLQESFPPLQSPGSHPNNLPTQLTSFIGREKELADVNRLLANTYLLTLIGPGGTGKTRLSLQAATDLLETFSHGVWLVELAPISDPSFVASTAAAALNLPAEVHRPALDMLCDYLREKELLLVLDNCEHLVGACARMVDRLLHAAPKLRILASSREALGIAGEVSYRVPSLGIPDLKNPLTIGSLNQYESVRLFIERATSAVPTFTVTNENVSAIAQICRRLDGIPLAIELAAVKVRVLSLEQIAKRLDDRFRLLTGGSRTELERHQTLRATLDWSYNLLSPEEQILFRRLSIFVNGWTLEAAESVCSDESTSGGIRSEDVLNTLEHLVNKSLVSAEEWKSETRYRVLETVRQYAREKLFESGEGEKVRDQHLKAFVELAEKAEPEIRGADQLVWLDRLDDEIDNLRAALEWSQERDKELFLQLASALWRFWIVRAYIADLEWLPRALAATEGSQTVLRARAAGRGSFVAENQGDIPRARTWAKEAEFLSRAVDDKPGLVMALTQQGDMETDAAQGLVLLDQALALAREIGDHWSVAGILMNRAESLLNRNDLASANSSFEQGVKEARRSGDKRRISYGLSRLGDIALAQGDAVQAEKWYCEGLAEAQAIRDNPNIWGNHWSILLTKIFLEDYATAKEMAPETFRLAQTGKAYLSQTFLLSGWIDLAQGNLLRALEQMEEGLRLAKQTTDPYANAALIFWLGEASRREGDFAGAITGYREALARYQEGNLTYGYIGYLNYCSCLEGLGMLAIDQGQAPRGARLLGAWERLRASEYVIDFLPFMVHQREAHIATAREQLGEEAFNQAWASGKAMSMEEAVKYALEETYE